MEAIENEALVEAFMKSNKTLNDALAFFGADAKNETKTVKRYGGRRKKMSK